MQSPDSFFLVFYAKRFEVFLSTQLAILFGALFVPGDLFETRILPLLYLLSILVGMLILYKKRTLLWFSIALFAIAAFFFGKSLISNVASEENLLIRLIVYFIFYAVVTWQIIKQVWLAQNVGRNVVLGLVSGYISLGFLAFFLFMSIALTHEGAFAGALIETDDMKTFSEGILYYGFITLLTIGYGEIVPAIPIAQKAAILVGLVGQFYMVIITAVVLEKYIRHSQSKP